MLKDTLDLFFELSNEERLNILTALQNRPAKLTHLSNELKMPNQEASRQIARLIALDLCYKEGEGNYNLTQYGSISLRLLSSHEFLSRNKRYFLGHNASILPYQFINRLGELNASSLQKDFITNYVLEGEMWRQAEEYAYSMGDQFNVNAHPIIPEKLKQGVQFRTILPENIVPPPGFRPAAGVDRRLIPNVQVNITVTDKKAMFGLSTLDGMIDNANFVSEDPKFRKWVLDLFNYYWDQGKPVMGPFPNLT